MPLPTADEIISLLSLSPHPEGGFYRQTFADDPVLSPNSTASTAPSTTKDTNHPTSSSSSSPASSPYPTDSSSPTSLTTRPASTLIYYLLPHPHFSSLHRIDATESWHYYMGTCPLEIIELDPSSHASTTPTSSPLKITTLGTNLLSPLNQQRPQHTVRKGVWFGARLPPQESKAGDWVLVGCGVAPGFVFEGGGFEMARRGRLREIFGLESESESGSGKWGGEEGEVGRVIEEMCRE